ncbi:amino acid adenylation domain-containing protein [Streptomyces sp. NPDC005955]|uniref:amino acid adenylation domain-containing protein n=1 Tax=Streptomyces sp. NPDC005955 TaxID=3364738 RepID=UPI0036BD3357
MTSALRQTWSTRSTGSLPELLSSVARAHPHRPALTDGTRAFDYATLDAVANRVAVRLAEHGIGPHDRVALVGPRDARMLALLHGVLRSGAAAVLADPEWSAHDLGRRLDTARVRRVLSTDAPPPGAHPCPTERLDIDGWAAAGPAGAPAPRAPGAATDLAYLSFTSGSGGQPKAVAVTHANAVHYARALANRLGYTATDPPRIAHVTTLAADLGHTAWLLALAVGGSAHVVSDREVRDPTAFWAALHHAGANALKTTPSHLAALLECRPPTSPPLHTVLLGGEPLSRSFAATLLDTGVTARVVNHYGPTETTVGATCFLASTARQLPADEATVPIGTGIGEVALRIVDGDGRPVVDGAVGELHIAGKGVSAGYYGRPAETARSFAHLDGRTTYRTGDLCRRRPDGNLVFVGRSDRQVKVRGFRVDLAEVERVMQEFAGVHQSAVLLRDTGVGRQLVAAVRLVAGAGAAIEELSSHLHDRLPGYSVPQPIVALPEFPIGPNGKLDRERLGALLTGAVEARAGRAAPGRGAPLNRRLDGLARAITDFWAGALGLPAVGTHADVLDLGGDSILVMRTIAFLRRSGLHLAYEDFYRRPTAAELAATAVPLHTDAPGNAAARTDGGGRTLAPAQRWLFGQSIEDPRHWNQSVVLRCRLPVDPAALSAALTAVLERHPALRRPITRDGYGAARPAREVEALSFSRLHPGAGPLARTVEGVCTALHRSLDPAAGRLVRAHLFTGPPGTDDRLALIVHHLVVDGLSWRILLDDLAHAYRAALDDEPVDLPPAPDFYRWAEQAPPAPAPSTPTLPAPVPGPAAGTEPAALVWTLGARGTARLIERYGAGPDLEAFLLAAFADATARGTGRPRLAVEVETHGRDGAGGTGDYLDTVGWFTAVKRIVVEPPARPDPPGPSAGDTATGPAAPHARARAVGRRLRDVPVLPMDVAGPRPETGFNFLGTFRLPDEPALDWTVADEQAGAARCPGGDPLYALRLTARVVEDRLVADLVYASPRTSRSTAERIAGAFARTVATETGTAVVPPAPTRLSTSGQLLYPGPRASVAVPGRLTVSEPARVLLTGATGYLGGHLLTALTGRGARVVCLVRAEDDTAAARRLGAQDDRVEVVAGDIDREGLGLTPGALDRARTARIVVHAAADVRLVASPVDLARTNHTAVRRLLGWVDAHTPTARFHHVSTLAVSGGVHGPARRFSEADLWIGQHFRTPYERTKFDAEETVRAWAATGRPCFVHRSGHIAAHSRSGAFQPNIGDNRIYQLIRGYLLAGAAPRRPRTAFAFSHVDTVAAGIAALALDPLSAPGTYHVETPHETPHDELVGWLAAHGHPIALTDDATFTAAITRAERSHPTAAGLTVAWSAQEERNVTVDSSYTTSVLDRLGVRFTPATPQWWSAALHWASDVGFLPPGGPVDRTA